MPIPTQVTFRNMGPSTAVEARVLEHSAGLERYHQRITACRVMVEAGHRHHHKGKLYHIRIEVAVPGGDIVVRRDPPEHHSHEEILVAIRDAFDAARRQLENHRRQQQGR